VPAGVCKALPVRRALMVPVMAALSLLTVSTASTGLAGCAREAPHPSTPPDRAGAHAPAAAPAPCLSQSDDGLFLICLQREIDEVWSAEFRDSGRHYEPPRLSVGEAAAAGAGHERDLARDRAYFSGRSGIHFPTRYLDDVHKAHGTRAHIVLTFTLGHETGHHVQQLLHPGVEAPDTEVETQADCYAGLWARREAGMGRLDVASFLSGADAEVRRLSQDPDEVRTHGSADQRIASVARGLAATGPAACDVGQLTWR